MLTLPFRQGQRVVELGGGDKPLYRPNIDARSGPNIDVVADFNGKLPIPDNNFDGVYCSYALEHISWRNVRAFLQETCRILAPGGTALFITANLLEQARRLVEREQQGWNDNDVCMVFGDLDYPENSHKCGFSPSFAAKLFSECGFEKILIVPHPATKTDMVIEAKKPLPKIDPSTWTKKDREKAYNRFYFDRGRGEVGGYSMEGYWDYPIHGATFQMIKEKYSPKSVLELGAARGYLLKRFEDDGLKVKGLEVSNHCYLTRVIEDIVVFDITETPWPIKDKEFDLAISVATLEHIPEDKIEAVSKELERCTERGLHGIDLGHHDDGFDKTHCNFKTQEWWRAHLPATHDVADKEALEPDGIYKIPPPDGKVKLNLGSFTTMFHHGWLNIDQHPLQNFANQHGFIYLQHDLTKGIPIASETTDLVYACHFLEHLTYGQGLNFLKECYRVMKPGALMRLLMPDARALMEKMKEGSLSYFDEINDGCANSPSQIAKLWELLFSGHQSMYDIETLSKFLEQVGFNAGNICRQAFRVSSSPEMKNQTLDMYPELSLFIEAVK